jgi:UV DNA damage endonuclease
MKIGYPCINRSISCSSGRTFRLASYSSERLEETVRENLRCLDAILRFNLDASILFPDHLRPRSVRVAPDSLPPLADTSPRRWGDRRFHRRTRDADLHATPTSSSSSTRKNPEIVARSVAELRYHAVVLDAMHRRLTATAQITPAVCR